MNSTVQCLKRVNELKEALKNYTETQLEFDQNKAMTKAAKQLFTELDFKGEPFAPYNFVAIMRQVFPQFNETDDHGHHKQQDAEECYSSLLNSFKQCLKCEDEVASDMVEKLFGIELVSTLKNKESEAEPPTEQKEHVLKLSCHIDNNNNPINHLAEGLKISLEGDIEKNSFFLNKNCVYFKQSLINRLVNTADNAYSHRI